MDTIRSAIEQAQSLRNQYTTLDVDTEGLRLGVRVFRKFYAIAARVNPLYFGTSAALEVNGSNWTLPATAEAVWLIRNAAGQEVIVVPLDDPAADTSRPALTYLGRSFTSAGNANDPIAGDALTAYYAQTFAAPATVDTALAAEDWPEQHDGLIASELAIHLAIKDGRKADVPELAAERDDLLRLYIAHLEHVVANEIRRKAVRRAIHTNTMVPLSQMLAGGSQVEL